MGLVIPWHVVLVPLSGTEPMSPALEDRLFTTESPGKSLIYVYIKTNLNIVVVHALSCVRLFAIPWIAVCQASLSFTVSRSLPKFMSTELAMLSSILWSKMQNCIDLFFSVRTWNFKEFFLLQKAPLGWASWSLDKEATSCSCSTTNGILGETSEILV